MNKTVSTGNNLPASLRCSSIVQCSWSEETDILGFKTGVVLFMDEEAECTASTNRKCCPLDSDQEDCMDLRVAFDASCGDFPFMVSFLI